MVETLKTENKERTLKAIREKGRTTYKGKPSKITEYFSTETIKARRTLFINEEEIKNLS
jgi:hypothetical protein